ncbi:nitrous oxide reductase accessory protein NosL [Bernardetia sp.]|uniref:nitrous oxide reductase accessory protein NosL n=1 Tax=Bernardetia sp. TaxID=1937974 RepID=UPI0025BE242D|nr:nitrous oxide reductase accessory protein NosL [Bernardetia sp.]
MNKIYLLIFVLLTVLACNSQTNKEENAKQTDNSSVEVKWTDCQNCGMPTNDFPNWQVMVKAEGKNVAFCSPRCMLIHLADSSNNIAKAIEKLEVTDYYTTQKIDGQTAFYVTGSDKTSAMGKDFIPFSTKEDAQNFMQEHNGKKIYSFREINKETVVSELK